MIDREIPLGELTDAAQPEVERAAAESVAARLDHWHELLGTGRAVAGLADTAAALRDGQVADLFIGDPPASEIWIGRNDGALSPDPEELRERGIIEPVRDLATAALIRAAAGTSAELFLVDEPDLGATLRYPRP